MRPILLRSSWTGAVCTGDFLRLLGISGCAIDSPNFPWATLMLWSHWLGHWFFGIGSFTLWSKPIGLHYVVWRCFTISPRPELVKLLALSNFPAFVHFVTCVSQDITASIVCFFGHYRSSMLPSPWSNAPLVTGISNPMAFLRRSSFFVHHWWRDSGMDLSSLTHSSAED